MIFASIATKTLIFFFLFLFLFFFFFFFSFSIFKGSLAGPHKIERPLDQIWHRFAGCPANSDCSAQLGRLKKTWLNLLQRPGKSERQKAHRLEHFRKTQGLPLNFWAKDSRPLPHTPQAPSNSFIVWDSHCPEHNRPGKKIVLAQSFVKNLTLKELPPSSPLIIHRAYLSSKGGLQSYPLPAGQRPSLLKGDSLLLLQEEEGHYYVLKIALSGKMEVVPNLFKWRKTKEVKCPSSLLNRYRSQEEKKHLAGLYLGHYCRSVWNVESRHDQTMLLLWTCQ